MSKTLLQETIKVIDNSGHTPEQIIFIGSADSGHCCTWEEFKVLADKTYIQYYMPREKVACDLIIVFNDGVMMWREEDHECGYSYWKYQKPYVLPGELKPIKSLFGKRDCELKTIN